MTWVLWLLIGLCSAVLYGWLVLVLCYWLYRCRKWHEENVWRNDA